MIGTTVTSVITRQYGTIVINASGPVFRLSFDYISIHIQTVS